MVFAGGTETYEGCPEHLKPRIVARVPNAANLAPSSSVTMKVNAPNRRSKGENKPRIWAQITEGVSFVRLTTP